MPEKSAKKTANPSGAPGTARSQQSLGPRPGAKEEPESEWKENLAAVLIFSLIVLAVWGFAHSWFSGEQPVTEERYPVTLGPMVLGNRSSAQVAVIEFSDYGCAACKRFHAETFPVLKARYIDTGLAVFAHRDFPMDELHPEATDLAAAAGCADRQGAFWAFYDAFYQLDPTEELIGELAGELGLDVAALDDCRASGAMHRQALADKAEGQRFGVAGTPTFFINGRRMVGAQPSEEFTRVIDEELGIE